jgi:hypothetical protein
MLTAAQLSRWAASGYWWGRYSNFHTFRVIMRNIRIPEVIHPLLHDYMQLLAQSVPDLTEACYLHGSIALNAFNERLSDIDFVTVLRRRPTPQDIIHLKTSHQILSTTYPNWSFTRCDRSFTLCC